ncbi:TetR/AcrR family transcriptional regulator [Pantoea sp. A4]|uniref:TetR/AcrR family transcriptional regulator n=1 Tax=Pantoea sp. A4 TaxID=1225184 RepID=UPI0003805F66|nr:TetR/AcrR family transcriptional regulator [Pantoea sp. A4]
MSSVKFPPTMSKKDRVAIAATEVFLTHGFSAATTDMIQQAAGVSKATVYASWSSKEALFSAVIEQQCAQMSLRVQAIQPTKDNVVRTLNELGQAYLAIVLSPVALALFRVVSAEAPRFPALARTFWQSGPVTIAAIVAERLAEAVAAGELDVQRTGVSAAAVQFVSLLKGEAQMECLMHPQSVPSEAQVERWVEQAVGTFLAAFSPERD